MRDAELHLPQAFVGALLACMLLVAALVANSAFAASAIDPQTAQAVRAGR